MNQFAVSTLVPKKGAATVSQVSEAISEKPKVYSHGFSDTEVQKITAQKELISARDLVAKPVTLDEFKTVIVPFNRLHRTTQFNIMAASAAAKKKAAKKPRAARVVKPKAPKKLTKKAIAARLNEIIFKQATGVGLLEGDQEFYDEHLGEKKI